MKKVLVVNFNHPTKGNQIFGIFTEQKKVNQYFDELEKINFPEIDRLFVTEIYLDEGFIIGKIKD